ncbi:hypothetical protein JHD48_02900 [Sulfurimonas sp. SAG-AH-194-I05]|nr:hypothetical protein [Sulfurimonas sp. SAG-AH-194-I05]MDF1874680.1 hypothetical protein [Sulfurimonas sp. SAG-AH-194-I05]
MGEFLYSLVGIIGISFIIYKTLRSSRSVKVKSKDQKRLEIIAEYTEFLESTLIAIKDKDLQRAKKISLLKKFSDELAMNVFFDKEESNEIILNLSKI